MAGVTLRDLHRWTSSVRDQFASRASENRFTFLQNREGRLELMRQHERHQNDARQSKAGRDAEQQAGFLRLAEVGTFRCPATSVRFLHEEPGSITWDPSQVRRESSQVGIASAGNGRKSSS
jgi:hypothetical protein